MEVSRLTVKGCKFRPILSLWMSGNCGDSLSWDGTFSCLCVQHPKELSIFFRISFYPPWRMPWILVEISWWCDHRQHCNAQSMVLNACVGKRWIMGGERDSKYIQASWNLSALQTETNCYFKTFHLAADCRKRFRLCMQEQSLQIATWCRVAIWYMYIKYVFSFYNAQCDELMTTKLHLIYFKHVYQELHL